MISALTQRTPTYPVSFAQKGNQVEATWQDPAIGTFAAVAPTKALAEKAALRQQQKTLMLLTIEAWLEALKAKGLLPNSVDQFISDALWG